MFHFVLIFLGFVVCLAFPPALIILLPIFLAWLVRTNARAGKLHRQRKFFLETMEERERHKNLRAW